MRRAAEPWQLPMRRTVCVRCSREALTEKFPQRCEGCGASSAWIVGLVPGEFRARKMLRNLKADQRRLNVR